MNGYQPISDRGQVATYVALVCALVVSAITFGALEAVWTLFIPVALSGLPVLMSSGVSYGWRQSVRWGMAALLVGWVIIASFSVGLFYVPSAVAMVVSALMMPRTLGDSRDRYQA